MKTYLAVVLFSFSAFSCHAQVKKNITPTILFAIDDKPVYTNEFVYLYKKNHVDKDHDFTQTKIDEYLNLFINFKLKITEAQKRGLDTTAKFRKELAVYRDELKKPYRAEKNLLDKLTKETYERLKLEVNASHILIQLKPDATPEDTLKAFEKITAIRKRILAGEDFEKLARELSDDPSAKYNGGSMGYFTAMQMVYRFEEAAYQTNPGEVSLPIRTRFGYHLVKVLDKRPSRGEVEVSHILLRLTKDNEAKTRNLIFEIYDQLRSGRNWDELCKQYSEDPNTKNSGGRLRPFGVGARTGVPEFESAAFAIQNPGDISDPFQSGIGWHIIRLERKIAVPPYSEAEAALKKRVARDERMKISEDGAAAKRRKDLAFRENNDTKTKVLALADSGILKGKWKFSGSPALKEQALISLSGKDIKVAEFVAFAEQRHTTGKGSPGSYMEQLYRSWIDEKIEAAEEERIIKENPDFKYLLSEYREGILLFEIMEKEIWNKASEDSMGQRKFYQEHLTKYNAGNRIDARVFSTTDKTFLVEVMKRVANGDTLREADMKKFKSIQNFRNYEKGDSRVIDRINWMPGLQETEIDGTFYMVDVRQLIAPGTKSLAEAKAKVISDYQDALEKIWVAQLRNKLRVNVNSKGVKLVKEELVRK